MNDIIAVAAVLFPIVMNRFLGWDIPTDPDSIISFILLGLGAYFVYLLAKSIYKTLKFTEKFAKEKAPKIEREDKPKKDKTYNEDKEDKRENNKQKKELEERERELSRREQELRWKSSIAAEKKRKDWTKEYHTLEETKQAAKPSHKEKGRPAIIEPLPVIEHKRKKKRKD